MAILELKGLGASLGDPPRNVLAGVDLSFERGTISLLLGPNGSGKSVLLRTILGLVPSYEGEILLDGTDLRRQFSRLHRRAGVVFQNPDHQLFGDTVREDISIGLPADRDPDPTMIRDLGITELQDRPPSELSGGQRRNVAIAGAFAPSPDFIFLDEPFIELDFPAIRGLLKQLQELRRKDATILVASHESQDIWPLVDQLVILQDGQVLYRGDRVRGSGYVDSAYGLRPIASGERER